ncbi:MAG: tRNA(Ile)-lysidine synthase [Gammaproteobacteria bacterium]|nr:MAG: tRNA(Ile)-lysidine synthase [Gammaproteobacteria bacterium]
MNPAAALDALLERAGGQQGILLAYSGGLDSSVLLHVAVERLGAGAVEAIHVDHGLQPAAADWVAHCRATCARLGVALHVERVDARPGPRESPEAAARRARRAAFLRLLPPGALLLTAQHRDDQVETLLLQLLRGAGPAGLAGMPALAPFGAGRIGRPFLGLGREVLRAWAQRHGLRWVEDPSNVDPAFGRGRLRRQLLPVLRRHWPAADKTLARAAELQAEAAALLAERADEDLQAVGAEARRLPLGPLRTLSAARRRNALRRWLQHAGLRPPPAAVLRQIEGMIAARGDAAPAVCWRGTALRRHRDALYLVEDEPRPPAAAAPFDPARPLSLPGALVTVDAAALARAGLDPARLPPDLTLRLRRGGERLETAAGHRSLKKLLQERGVPPWLRGRLPLLFAGEELIAVFGLDPPLVAARWRRGPTEPGA